MEHNNQPSPYFIRRTVRPENQPIEISDFSVVEDQVHPLRDYWLIVKRHRWLILSCAVVLFISSALYTFTRTPLYTAEATLLIERKAPQILKLQDARGEASNYNDYNNEFYKTQYEILKSRALAERVVRDQGLESHPLFGGGQTDQSAKPGLVSGLWQQVKNTAKGLMAAKSAPDIGEPIAVSARLAARYLLMLEVRPVAGTSLVTIKITTPDPALSARLADAHASSYVRYGIDLRSQTNDEAGDFLQQKLVELKERIEQSEAALNSYRKEKGIISVDDKSNVIIERLLDLNKGLTAAEGERIAWEAQVRAARGRSAEEVPSVRNSAVIGSLKAELGKFEVEYASLAKEFKAGYPPLDNLKARIDETRRRLNTEIDREVSSIEAGYAAATNRESQLRVAMDEQKRATLNLKDAAVQYAILAREVDTNKQLYDGVLSRLKEIGVAADVRSSNIHFMGKALAPGVPSYPNKRRTLMLGLLLGVGAGIGIAFLLEQLDNTLKTPEEAERYLHLPTLGIVPDFARLNGHGARYGYGYVSRMVQSAKGELAVNGNGAANPDSKVILDHHPLSLVTEAYRTFRSSLMLSQAGGPPHTVLVTSALRGEGKTTTLVNTAVVFAQLGVPVLIIDGDLRRPNCHRLLKMDNSAGLAELLAGQIDVNQAIRSTPVEKLSVISAGALPPNPAELLGSERMHELLQQLRQRFEFIFVDSSPLLAVSDGLFLSTMVDGTLLVVNRKTPKPLVKKARARLSVPQGKIVGMLLNRVDIHNNEYGGYYKQYDTYYGADSPDGSPLLGNGNGTSSHNSAAVLSDGNVKHSHLSRRQQSSEISTPKPCGHRDGQAIETPLANSNATGNEVPSELRDTPEFLKVLEAKSKEALGPMAPVVITEHIHALGEYSRSFPKAKLETLIKRISKEIVNDSHRMGFEKAMSAEIKIALRDTPQIGWPKAAAGVWSDANERHSTAAAEKAGVAVENSGMRATSRNGLPAGFLDRVRTKLGEAMGPMAPLVLSDQIRALGESVDSFPEAKLEELTKRVSEEIFDEYHRTRFTKEIRDLGAEYQRT